MFDIGFGEFAVLAIIALFVFGPDKLPKVVADVTRTLRELRRMAQGAQRELTESLDPELKGIDLASLDPRTFVRRTLMEDDLEGDARSDRAHLQSGSVPPASQSAAARRSAPRPAAATRPAASPSAASPGESTLSPGTSSATDPEPATSKARTTVRTPAPWDDDTT